MGPGLNGMAVGGGLWWLLFRVTVEEWRLCRSSSVARFPVKMLLAGRSFGVPSLIIRVGVCRETC